MLIRTITRPVTLGAALALAGGLSGFGAGTAFAAPSSAGGTCGLYNVTGTWSGQQNSVPGLDFVLQQNGAAVTGSASYPSLAGTVTGTVSGSTLDMIVTWNQGDADNDSLQGEYVATISPGLLSNGTGQDVDNSSSTATWSATGTGGNCSTPLNKDQCKSGGWMGLTDASGASFKNQGDCVSYIATGGHNSAAG